MIASGNRTRVGRILERYQPLKSAYAFPVRRCALWRGFGSSEVWFLSGAAKARHGPNTCVFVIANLCQGGGGGWKLIWCIRKPGQIGNCQLILDNYGRSLFIFEQ